MKNSARGSTAVTAVGRLSFSVYLLAMFLSAWEGDRVRNPLLVSGIDKKPSSHNNCILYLPNCHTADLRYTSVILETYITVSL